MVTEDKEKPRVFMAVYNVLACDGRVQRAAEALAEVSHLTLLGIASKAKYQIPNVEIRQVCLPRLRLPGAMRLLLFWAAFLWEALRAKPQVVYAHDFFLLFPGWLASRLPKAKLVYDAHELIVPDGRRFRSFSHRVFYFLERHFVKRADLVIAANEPRAAIMKATYGLQESPVVVRNIPPYVAAEAAGADALKHLPPINGKIRLIYQGAMSLARGIDMFIRVLPRLRKDYELVMVGDGPDTAKLKQIAQEEGVRSRVTFLGRVSTQDLARITRQCSIGIVSYSFDDPNERLCAPNKVYEYAQAGIPIVATAQKTLRELVEANGIGAVLESGQTIDGTIENYANGIERAGRQSQRFVQRMPDFLGKNNWGNERNRLIQCLMRVFRDQI